MRKLEKNQLQSIQGGWIWLHGFVILALAGQAAEMIKELIVEGPQKCAKDLIKGVAQADANYKNKK